MSKFGFTASFDHCAITGIQDQSKLIAYSFKYDGAISESALYQDQHAFQLSNRTLYLLNILQQLPISKINHLNIQQDILNEMSELLIMLYREYAGMFLKVKINKPIK